MVKAKKIVELINNNGDKFTIKLDKKERIIICISKPYDITAVEILEKDKINNIKYLDYIYDDDMNKYINKEVFILQHPEGKELHLSSGIIKNIDKKIYEFEHTLDTEYGSSGSPVLLNENCKVIGIHKKRIRESDDKKGTFIFILIEKIIEKYNQSPYLFNSNEINDVNEITDNNNNDNELAENNLLILKYNLYIEDPVMLFSKRFFYRNKDKIIVYINEKEYKLTKNSIIINEMEISQNPIEIKVKIIEPFTDMSEMFCKCISLISVKFINCDTSNVKFMERLFAGCTNLKEIFGIDGFNMSEVEDINNLFSGCTSLINLPKTLYWDTSKVEKINNLFSGCESLTEIPDISKWNTKNVIYMERLFEDCKSLKTIPDIKGWNTSIVKNMSFMFHNCKNLETLPDISFWSTTQVKSLSNMFSYCKSLKSIPDISNWKTYNVKTMKNLFLFCTSVSDLPDISKWNTKNVTNMDCIFEYCTNVKKLPDISKLNIKKVKNKRRIIPKKKKHNEED